jgi:hypothetical protein
MSDFETMKTYYWNNENVLLEQLVLRWIFFQRIFLAHVNEKFGIEHAYYCDANNEKYESFVI